MYGDQDARKGVLYLKGSNLPGRREKQIGACIKSQRLLMILKLNNLEAELQVKFTYDDKPKKPPALDQGEDQPTDADKIASYLVEKRSTDSENPMESTHSEVITASTATVIKSLNEWLVFGKKKKFEDTLKQIDGCLAVLYKEHGGPFLCGEQLTFPDCNLLPKLYYARIVTALHMKKKYHQEYDFGKIDPREPDKGFKHIANYLKAAQKNPVFRETCPSEEDIQEKWENIVKTNGAKSSA